MTYFLCVAACQGGPHHLEVVKARGEDIFASSPPLHCRQKRLYNPWPPDDLRFDSSAPFSGVSSTLLMRCMSGLLGDVAEEGLCQVPHLPLMVLRGGEHLSLIYVTTWDIIEDQLSLPFPCPVSHFTLAPAQSKLYCAAHVRCRTLFPKCFSQWVVGANFPRVVSTDGQGRLYTVLSSCLMLLSQIRNINEDHSCVKPETHIWVLGTVQAQILPWPWVAIKLLTSAYCLSDWCCKMAGMPMLSPQSL